MKTAAILLNAPVLDCEISEKHIICADGGINLLPDGIKPYAIVGDLDSAVFVKISGNILRCPKQKDYTDGERAVIFAKEQGFSKIVIYGAKGGRSDHVYANLSLLALALKLGLKAHIQNANEQIFFFNTGKVFLDLPLKSNISLLPFGESVIVSHSDGLYYPYFNLKLDRIHSVGISNITTKKQVSFEITHGCAFVFINFKD